MLPILYRDEHLVAIAKPSGLLVHRTALDPRATASAVQLLRRQLGRHVYPAHRLDRATSGVMLFALTPEIHRALSSAFETRAIEKRYLAVVRGWPGERGTIERPLPRIVDDADPDADADVGARAARDDPPQPACTRFRRLALAEIPVRVDRYATSRYALLELEPLSGRRHQLRRHLKHADHPIVGDTTYGQGRHNRLFRERFACARLLLAAVSLRFAHPATGGPFAIAAPLAADFTAVVEALGWSDALAAAATSRDGVECAPAVG